MHRSHAVVMKVARTQCLARDKTVSYIITHSPSGWCSGLFAEFAQIHKDIAMYTDGADMHAGIYPSGSICPRRIRRYGYRPPPVVAAWHLFLSFVVVILGPFSLLSS